MAPSVLFIALFFFLLIEASPLGDKTQSDPTSFTASSSAAVHASSSQSGRHLCPIAYSGDNCNIPVRLPCFGSGSTEPISISQRWQSKTYKATKEVKELQSMLPPQPFIQPARGVTCAVVGNSPVLTEYAHGAQIDSHDMVFRINNAPTKGYETYTGRKTTIRLQNKRYSGFREHPGETLLGRPLAPALGEEAFGPSFGLRGLWRQLWVKKPLATALGEE
ncbi:hypothetical protein CYMTET_33234, partial [Cymbomonas tetramitiformis]